MAKSTTTSKAKQLCTGHFLYYFPKGFNDKTYEAWERNYKFNAHLAWQEQLNEPNYKRLLDDKKFEEIALTAVRIETKTNLLFSFEKMALRDAVKPAFGAEAFATGLYDYIYGKSSLHERFERWAEVLDTLPRKQTRVRTWPSQTVFGFIGNPLEHIFLKPRVTQAAAKAYGYDFNYKSKPNWDTYNSMLNFAEIIRKDQAKLKPKDMIDLQSFMWVLGSDEYLW